MIDEDDRYLVSNQIGTDRYLIGTWYPNQVVTLLHEFAHHLDIHLFGWSDTPHARGFYWRVDALYHLALGTPANKQAQAPDLDQERHALAHRLVEAPVRCETVVAGGGLSSQRAGSRLDSGYVSRGIVAVRTSPSVRAEAGAGRSGPAPSCGSVLGAGEAGAT